MSMSEHLDGHVEIETRCVYCGIVASCTCNHPSEEELWIDHHLLTHSTPSLAHKN